VLLVKSLIFKNRARVYGWLLLCSSWAIMPVYADFLPEVYPQKSVSAQQHYEEVVIEQSLVVSVEKSLVFSKLADLNNYAYFYPLFSELTINPQTKTEGQPSLLDFTAVSLQRFGPVFVEHQYYGMLAVDENRSRIELHLVDTEGVLIKLNMQVLSKEGVTFIVLRTTIKAQQQDLADLLMDELRAPTLRLEALKDLLEGESLPVNNICPSSANTNRYCF
jgi:hypothetical protein